MANRAKLATLILGASLMAGLGATAAFAADGKCGGEKQEKSSKCGAGKCGGEKKESAGKCGAGKCGGEKKEENKAAEMKCGAGKCGGSK